MYYLQLSSTDDTTRNKLIINNTYFSIVMKHAHTHPNKQTNRQTNKHGRYSSEF